MIAAFPRAAAPPAARLPMVIRAATDASARKKRADFSLRGAGCARETGCQAAEVPTIVRRLKPAAPTTNKNFVSPCVSAAAPSNKSEGSLEATRSVGLTMYPLARALSVGRYTARSRGVNRPIEKKWRAGLLAEGRPPADVTRQVA